MPTYSINRSVRRDAGSPQTAAITKTVTGDLSIQEDIPGSTNNVELTCSVIITALSYVYMISNKTLVIETNDDDVPDDVFTLAANEPFEWSSTSGVPLPFTADVTALFASDGTAGAANFLAYFGYDASP